MLPKVCHYVMYLKNIEFLNVVVYYVTGDSIGRRIL